MRLKIKKKIFKKEEKILIWEEIKRTEKIINDSQIAILQLKEHMNSFFTTKRYKKWYKEKILIWEEIKKKEEENLLYYKKKYNRCIQEEKRKKHY